MSENKLVDYDQGLIVDRNNTEFNVNDGNIIVARAFNEKGELIRAPEEIIAHYSDVTEADENMPPITRWTRFKTSVFSWFKNLFLIIKRWKMRRVLKNPPEHFAPDPTSETLAGEGLPKTVGFPVVSIKDINDILKK